MATEIKPLTSIRGIAAALVVAYHFHQQADTGSAALNHLIGRGYFWVDLFFVLSGFVMAMTYADRFAAGYSWPVHRDFLQRRVARVYPLYAAVTLAISGYSLLVYGGYGAVHRPAVHLEHPLLAHVTNLLMLHGWGFGESIGGSATWSISTEWAAYLLFPLLITLALRAGRWGASLLTLAAALLLGWVAITPETGQTLRNGQLDVWHGEDALALCRCLGGFCLGLLMFRGTGWQWLMQLAARDTVCAGLLLLLLAGMASPLPDLALYPLLPLLVLALYAVRGWAARFFAAAPFYWLGVLSYALYLLHPHFMVLHEQLAQRLPQWVGGTWAPWLAAACTYTLLLATAWGCYHWLEQPARRWLRRFHAA
jgi:peptidoglycan/LPS O-acetylase OafA/YrhL